jgi:hypothetical protein
LLILCDFISTILDNFPEAFPREGCHLNKDTSLDGYRAVDNSCSDFVAGDHAGMGPLKRKLEKGYGKTTSFIENV